MAMTLTLLAALFATSAEQGGDDKGFESPAGNAAKTGEILSSAVQTPSGDEAANRNRSKALTEAIETALTLLAPESPVAERLSTALNAARGSSTVDASKTLNSAVEQVVEQLQFAPIKEAELPEGFPTYTRVGTIDLKKYPTRRRAVGPGFFPLFMHIQANEIAMTTPVQMDFEATDSGNMQSTEMSFFYEESEIGTSGKKGAVRVVDADPLLVVSLGMRGSRNSKALRDAEQRLRTWVANHPEYEVAGKMRVMGYNSPMVASSKQFYEVQLPLTKLSE